MKKNTYIALALFALLLCSCNKIDELPPMTDGITDNYLIPQGSVLTAQEREIIQARIDEYQAAIK